MSTLRADILLSGRYKGVVLEIRLNSGTRLSAYNEVRLCDCCCSYLDLSGEDGRNLEFLIKYKIIFHFIFSNFIKYVAAFRFSNIIMK